MKKSSITASRIIWMSWTTPSFEKESIKKWIDTSERVLRNPISNYNYIYSSSSKKPILFDDDERLQINHFEKHLEFAEKFKN
jgi:hypothetical protein